MSAVAWEPDNSRASILDKGTIRFQPERPLPDDVVRALVLARKEQIEGLTSIRFSAAAPADAERDHDDGDDASRMRHARGVESQRPR